ncbi:Eco57I restriction-modification methylase domain-containing protein [Citricoccus alkalitolerans]|uniref:site-specific DNA-methyltransferase (adenine-specific) n=1 Tax=Citricoccus alkalitolerans TaxID=246603 RepID=A0ABV8XXP6_9MICC
MPANDALVVVNDWISEYYFTANETSGTFLTATKNLVKQWKEDSEESTSAENPLERFTTSRQALLSQLIDLHARGRDLGESATVQQRREALARPSAEVSARIRAILGFDLAPQHGDEALRWCSALDMDEPTIALIDAVAAETPEELLSKESGLLTEDVLLHRGDDDGDPRDPICSVSALLSALVSREQPPRYMLVLAGRTAVLTSEDTWPQGRYLAIDLQTVAERGDARSGGEIQRMLACLSATSLAPDPTGTIWWDARREESVRNAVGVSKDLREGVRESIEIIANEVVARRKARGLPPLPDGQAQPLAVQSLRYLYRILFLLYAEASPELGVVPTGDPEYEAGYSMDRLRELTLKKLTTRSETGTHFYESLQLLFDLVESGHAGERRSDGTSDDTAREGLIFEALRSDLFRPNRTAFINEVQLGNKALQQVLKRLLLTKERRGRERGFISYVALGINQLGAVYESLMSYTGSFASGTLVEVARRGEASDGSWVVPEECLDDDLREHLVLVHDELGREVPRTYHHGEFVFRLSGRQRQQSASYYSPEVLTEFTVQQGLTELLSDNPPAEAILGMSVCEPALGSGAFAIEAVRQLAKAYLEKRQEELGRKIDPEDYPVELQRTKAYIALHNVYGVDLNPTAVELAEVSLWLDTMARGLKAPWFGLRLRAGNSLIGARHAVYDAGMVQKARPKDRMQTPARHVPLEHTVDASTSIFHFLLPAEGWGAAGANSEIKTIAPAQAKALRDWASRVQKKPSKTQLTELLSLTERIDDLWQLARRRMVEAEKQSRRSIEVWGAEPTPGGGVTREEIEASLRDSSSAYRRLRLVMDAWCAMWFWPVTQDAAHPAPPELDEWLTIIRQIVGQKFVGRRGRQFEHFGQDDAEWETLENIEAMFPAENAVDIDHLLEETPWLRAAQAIAKEQRFFHWELDFAAVFARGGFDLQVGNPPWVRPALNVAALLGESDPWWALTDKPSEAAKKERRNRSLDIPGAAEVLLLGARDSTGLAKYVGAVSEYPELQGTQPDLYRAFMAQTWRHASGRGHTALIHPPTHLTDARGYSLRRHTYRHLRRHWNFLNELLLFEEVDHHKPYSVNVYGQEERPGFLNAISMYHPSTAIGSLAHNGDGPEPGFKNEDGKWDLRPHASRIEHVNYDVFSTWHTLMESGSAEIPVEETRMVFTINRSASDVLQRLTATPTLDECNPQFSSGWHETGGRRDGYFETRWGKAESWDDVILQGPNFHVGNPFYASRNATMRGNQDYSSVDLETLPVDALPVTEYKPIHQTDVDGSVSMARYDRAYGLWKIPNPQHVGDTGQMPVRDHFRIMWRRMAATTGERTMIPAIFPPGTGTIDGVSSIGFPSGPTTQIAQAAASMSSLITDFMVRSTAGSDIRMTEVERLPRIPEDHPLASAAILRILRLSCLTAAYGSLWEECWDPVMAQDFWTGGRVRLNRPVLGDVAGIWTAGTPLRVDEDRRRALVEIDAIMAHVTGVPIDELCTIYRTQFGVLYRYDLGEDKRAKIYDDDGRLIPSAVRAAWNKAGRPEFGLREIDRTYTNPSGREITASEPFRILDREADLREAYAAFAERLESVGGRA